VTAATAGAWNNAGYANDNSAVTAAHLGASGALVTAGDSDGFVRLFRQPCTTPRAEYREDKIATGAISSVRLVFEDAFVLAAASASDGMIVRWKVK
jgi:microtubule-associated protein-like 1/2